MKIVVLTLALTLLSLISHTNAGNPLIMVFAKTCQKNESASEEDVENLSDGIVPETPAGKCLLGKNDLKLFSSKLNH